MRAKIFLALGGVLLVLLGLARGAGGVVLLLRGGAAEPGIRASASAVTMVGAMLGVIAVAAVVAGAGVLRRVRGYWTMGIWSVLAFVVGGAINGAILYGRPGDQGTLVNVVAAVLILTCLILGRRSLRNG